VPGGQWAKPWDITLGLACVVAVFEKRVQVFCCGRPQLPCLVVRTLAHCLRTSLMIHTLQLPACRVPLIVHALLDVPASDNAAHTESAHMTNDTRILLLAAVPYVAGVATHVVNALHSHRVNERRWVCDRLQGCGPAQLKK
jgi:hypothetical protein